MAGVGKEDWQIVEIQQALKEADANDLASAAEIDAVVRKYAEYEAVIQERMKHVR